MPTSKLMEKYAQEKVSNYMTRDVITVTPNTPIEKVIDLFIEHGFHGIPVLKGKKLKGIALEKDLLELFFVPEHSLKDMRKMMKINSMLDPEGKVEGFMRRSPIVVNPDYSVGYLVRLMLRHDVLTVPIVSKDNKELEGIISITDLQELINKARDHTSSQKQKTSKNKTK